MPTSSFAAACQKQYSKIQQDHFDKVMPPDDDDEHNVEFEDPSEGQRDKNLESEEDSLEWEIGIRWSDMAKNRKIEDLTMSDIILDPDGSITYYWLGIVTMAVIYNTAVIILRTAFKEMREQAIEESVFDLLDTIGDLIYMTDIIVHLRVSYYEDGCLVLQPGRLLKRYTRSTKFLLDLGAILPLGLLCKMTSGIAGFVCHDQIFHLPGDLYILVVRLPRLFKYPTMVRFFDLTDSRTRNPNLIRAFKLSLNLWIFIHWVGCVYYVLSEYEGLGTNKWVYENGTENCPFSRKYIRVAYWSLMTLTTIGEHPPPETDLEFVFTGATFLIGVFVFAAIVGNVGDVITNMNAARTEFQSRMDQIKLYLRHRNVDEKLQNRVKRWADYAWTRTQSIDEPFLLQMLPDRLRSEIAINVHLDTLKKSNRRSGPVLFLGSSFIRILSEDLGISEVEIFEECEEGLLRELVLKLRPQVYSPGDFICRIGEVGREMFIVSHGKVEILVPSVDTNQQTVVATLTPGHYFGEISLLKMDDGQNRRTADVKAIGFSELLRLSRRDLMSALIEYPNAKRILEQQAKERIQKMKEMRRNSCIVTNASSMPNMICKELSSGSRKDHLYNIIQSENFKRILNAHNSEMSELQKVLLELKQFDSQATRDTLASLHAQTDELERQLQKRNREVVLLKSQMAHRLHKRQNNMCLVRKPNFIALKYKRHKRAIHLKHVCDKCDENGRNEESHTRNNYHLCHGHNRSPKFNLDGENRQLQRKHHNFPLCFLMEDTNANSCHCQSLSRSSTCPNILHTHKPKGRSQSLQASISENIKFYDKRTTFKNATGLRNSTSSRKETKSSKTDVKSDNVTVENVSEYADDANENILDSLKKVDASDSSSNFSEDEITYSDLEYNFEQS